jgi:hypothetical protein
MIEDRCDQLVNMGFMLNATTMEFYGGDKEIKDMNVHLVEIQCSSEKEWEKIINDIQEEIKNRYSKS